MSQEIEIISIDDDQLDTLFSGTSPEGTFKAEDLEPAKKTPPTKEEEKPSKDSDKKEEILTPESISEEDEDSLFEAKDEDKEDKKAPKLSKEDKETETKGLNFKAVIDHLVETGKWVDFDGREEIEQITEEEFLAMSEQQDEFRVSQKYNDVLDRTGEYGKAIIEFEKNGGNPAELLGLFREQRDILSVDLDDTDNQEEIIKAYYEAQGEEEDWINEYIESVKDRGLEYLKKDAQKKHSRLLEDNKESIAQAQAQQEAYKKNQEQAVKEFELNIRKNIHGNSEFSNPEKKELEKFLLAYNNKLNDGRLVNGFLLKMKEIQQDPQKYIKLAKFVQDMDKYEEKIKKQAEKETNKRQWKFIHESQNEKHAKAGIMPEQGNAKKADAFSLTFKV